ncbi:predicted protein [Naegleria gruberi]|uniref:Fucosyltransferase n=1 Tax=Naegleria gruberi TaxID=5762 RepID=D2VYA1_NAEGR|nr:uncharacterized protein NAEGRDRAFT_74045 [Naegleria gruberi]EFC38212.1 predicted protein [Naegleria gruberi]|eukprot:XP_002670956.1 predicted protein [Naegleria gruberi strain NEG-M]
MSPKRDTQRNFLMIANLLTNPDQRSEGSYGWYQEQLELNNNLGKVKFSDKVMVRFGFQETSVTGKDMFHYFRTFNTKEKCPRQHSCEVFVDTVAGEIINNKGINLDAVLVHYNYKPPFFLSSLKEQTRNIDMLHTIINGPRHELNEKTIIEHSNAVDNIYGESMWRGMRRLSLFMCSEAVMARNIQPLIQKKGEKQSMQNFSESPADISICFLKTCTVWVNCLYYPIEIIKTGLFGKKPLAKNKGVCAFISNCHNGDLAKSRYQLLTKLSEYVPIHQYGACGKNIQEGHGGKQFELDNNCRFYFAVENSMVTDYVSEKFFEGLKALQNGAKLMMIYKGAPNFKEWNFPPNSFINIDDFESPEKLGEYLKSINDDEAFEKRFNQITLSDQKHIDKAVRDLDYRLGQNIPCRICKSIGEMKLARYLLFKIGLKPENNKVNYDEWSDFRRNFESLGKERLKILDRMYYMAYSIFQEKENYKNIFNLGWEFNKKG